MYCVKCGKQIAENETLCQSCKEIENAAKPAKSADSNKSNTSMLCFGRALAAAIMGFGVFIVSSVLNSVGLSINIISMVFMLIIDISVIVLAIVFGSQAIRAYGTFKSTTDRKPIPAFVLGIIGVILAGIATVIVLIFLFVELPNIGTVVL